MGDSRLKQYASCLPHPHVAEFGLLAWEPIDEIIEASQPCFDLLGGGISAGRSALCLR